MKGDFTLWLTAVRYGVDRRHRRWILSPHFGFQQKRMLLRAFSSPWITEEDMKIIANPNFSLGQMREVFRACQELTREQVLMIADEKKPASVMHMYRLDMRKYERQW